MGWTGAGAGRSVSIGFARDAPISYISISHGSNIHYISRSYHNTNPKFLQHFSRLNFPPHDTLVRIFNPLLRSSLAVLPSSSLSPPPPPLLLLSLRPDPCSLDFAAINALALSPLPPSFHTHSPQELVLERRGTDITRYRHTEIFISTRLLVSAGSECEGLTNPAWETKAMGGRIGAVIDPLIVNNQPSSGLRCLDFHRGANRRSPSDRNIWKEHKVHRNTHSCILSSRENACGRQHTSN